MNESNPERQASHLENPETASEFKIPEIRNVIAFLEREYSSHKITEGDLSLEFPPLINEEKKRSIFIFRLNKQKSLLYFREQIFYHFMNEPFHTPPRFEVERVTSDTNNPNDISMAETIFKYENGIWGKV